VLASHSNARALVPGDRQLSDEMIRSLVQRDGVIGCVMDAWMLVPGWKKGQSNADVKLAMVADHIDHVCQVAGSARHAAIGSDLDGGFGREQCPSDLDSVADLPRLLEVLAGRGYGADDLHAIAHGNWLRLLRRAWDER
jgi:membrane dipeptidase